VEKSYGGVACCSEVQVEVGLEGKGDEIVLCIIVENNLPTDCDL
jgi:hypothetical protein